VICDLAGEDVVGKTDRELVWAKDADALQAHDKRCWRPGRRPISTSMCSSRATAKRR
jgi:hypothetical protein